MPTPATQERHRFADTLAEVGPDAPTLCEGWTTRDLAAHVVLPQSTWESHLFAAELGVELGGIEPPSISP